jgi:hypothetical protein
LYFLRVRFFSLFHRYITGAGLVPKGWRTSKTSVNCSLIKFLAKFQHLAMLANLAKEQKGIGEKASS